MRLRLLFTTGLLLLVGCRSSALPNDLVLVQLQLPSGLQCQGFRVRVMVDGVEWKHDDRLLPAAAPSLEHTLGVHLPAERQEVRLYVQAFQQGEAVAEGQATLQRGGSISVPLVACAQRVPLSADFRSCLSQALDAGVEAGPDGGIDLGVPDNAPDARLPWSPPACLQPVDGGSDGGLPPRAAPDDPACVAYCDSMERRCPQVFLTRPRCLSACAQLGWDAQGGFNTDSVSCRTLWADAELTSPTEQAKRCDYASPISVGACGDICDVYCRMGARLCPMQFPPEDDCKNACRWTRDRRTSLEKPLVCRSWVLAEALFDRSRCPAAGPYATCGEVCPPVTFDPE
jgi:hypothetical protein